jgi:branched-chain amino acid transport system permease protein
VIYGILMVLVVYFLPEGIVPAVRNWWQARQQTTVEDATSEKATAEAAR